MNITDFLKLLVEITNPHLSFAGFQYSGNGTWKRLKGQDLNVIWIQKHSVKPVCCVNLGIHYSFLPKAGTEEALTGNNLDQPDCEIKLRLTTDPAQQDQWWPFSSETADALRDLIASGALNIFDSYKLEGPISKLEAKDLEETTPSLLAPLTKVRAVLLIARIQEHFGNHAKAIEAASLGIKIAGMAVGPKKAFKDILKRYERLE